MRSPLEVSRVASGLLCLHAIAITPAGPTEFVRSSVSIVSGLPCEKVRSAPAIVFSGPAQRSLTLWPARSPSRLATLYIESSDSFVASAAVSIATGWSEPVPGRELHPLKSSAFHGALYRQQGTKTAGRWELEASLPIAHSRTFPRDLRGRLLLRRDHLFDVNLPGTFCRTNSIAAAPLTLTCNDSDDPWPLAPEDGAVRAFFAPSRNFFTAALSPGIGKVSNVPSFYSAAALPRSSYTLWVFVAVDGSLHLVDGMTDQLIRGVKWGSDLAAVHSSCGTGTQLLVSESQNLGHGDAERDGLRAFEIPDRDPVAASAAVEFDGRIVALWPETSGNGAAAIVKRKDTGWYEAYRVSISCGN